MTSTYSRLVSVAIAIALSSAVCAEEYRHRDPAPMSDEVVQAVVADLRARAKIDPRMDQLEQALARTNGVLLATDAALGGNRVFPETLRREMQMQLEGQLHQIQGLRAEILSRFGQVQKSVGRSAGARSKDELSSKLGERFDSLESALKKVQKATDESAFRLAVSQAKVVLHQLYWARAKDDGGPRSDDPQGRRKETPPSAPAVPSKVFPQYVIARNASRPVMYAYNGNGIPDSIPADAATSCGYGPADLAGTSEAPVNDEIKALAKSLDFDVRKIHNFVYEEIKFEPYWGATKGGLGALWTKAGGPMDQASLLVALLRASNVPARYVRGTIDLPGDKGRLWVGAKTDIAAATIFGSGHYPTFSLLSPSGLRLSHVWVEACVPYSNYRGTRTDSTGSRWIPLDPSYKEMVYQPGIDHNVSFDFDSYIQSRTNTLPHERMGQLVSDAIRVGGGSNANRTLADVPYKGTLVKRQFDVLPSSLPYDVYSYDSWDNAGGTSELAVLPDSHRLKVRITLPNQLSVGGAPDIDYQGFLSELAFKRITVSHKGLDANAQTNLDDWRYGRTTSLKCSFPYTYNGITLPMPYMVPPVLKIDGVQAASGGGLSCATRATKLI